MDDFFKIVAAGPAFFVSAWLLMIFAGIVGAEVGIRPFGYLTSMVVTIALWLTLAPAIGAIARTGQGQEELSRAAVRCHASARGRGRDPDGRAAQARGCGRWRAELITLDERGFPAAADAGASVRPGRPAPGWPPDRGGVTYGIGSVIGAAGI